MAKPKISTVTMRVRVGDSELEVSGPSDFVEKKIGEFLTKSPAAAHAAPAAIPASAVGQARAGKTVSPAQFFKAANPRTDTDRVLVAAYYLEKFRNAQNATAAEIRDVIKEAKWQPPKNTNDAANSNIRKGTLMTAGDRENKLTFVVTSDGEAIVEEMAGKRRD